MNDTSDGRFPSGRDALSDNKMPPGAGFVDSMGLKSVGSETGAIASV
jgi:hypothetical protein